MRQRQCDPVSSEIGVGWPKLTLFFLALDIVLLMAGGLATACVLRAKTRSPSLNESCSPGRTTQNIALNTSRSRCAPTRF